MASRNGQTKDNMERLNIHLLRGAAILLPFLFLAIVDILRHTTFVQQLHSLPGFIGTYVIIGVAIIIFSYTMFSLIARLEKRIVDQNRQLSALNDIAKAAATKPLLNDLLQVSLDQILSNMRADAGLICLVDLEKEEHSAVCYKGFSKETVGRIQRAKLQDDPVASKVVRTGRPVIRERVLDDPNVSEGAKREGIRSFISAPLKSEGEVNGILAIACHTERHFSNLDQEFLEGIGGQLGLAIRNAQLYEQSQLQNRELSALLAVGKVATSSFNLDELLKRLLSTINEETSSDAAEIWLMEDNNEELSLRSHEGAYREAFLERNRFQVGEGIPGLVAQRQEPILIRDLQSSTNFLRPAVIKAGIRAFCALPLTYQDKVLGVLAVAARSVDAIKDPRDIRLLGGIGEWLALAIENIHLYQQVQDMATLQERERIAREMHDGMAQLLGYINTQTIAVKKLLSNEQIIEAREELTKMEEIARDLYADVREGILGLRTTILRREGLLSAVREYLERYSEMSGISTTISVLPENGDIRLPPPSEIQLMRIVQEALTNVRRHSKATSAKVIFHRNEKEVSVIISDNGQGFAQSSLPVKGWPRFGLQTMKERAEAIGGTLQIDTSPGSGTRITVQIPLA